MHEDLRNIHHIESEADALYGKWRAAMERFGSRDDYWARIIQLADDFGNDHGDYGKQVISQRVWLIEKKWREYLGITYSGTIESTLGEESEWTE